LLKVFRNIARLNYGGPGRHCLWLFELDKKYNYQTLLVHGNVEDNENELPIPEIYTEKTKRLKNLKRSIGLNDFFIFIRILSSIFKFKPDIVHTHTSKAGFHGRVAAGIYNLYRLILFKKKAIVFHTFHGHIFQNYFSGINLFIIKILERLLATFLTDVIVVISPGQFYDLTCKFKIIPSKKTRIVPIGIDERLFDNNILQAAKGSFRKEFNIGPEIKCVAIISRIAYIKNHKLFLNICKKYVTEHNDKVHFFIVGDGSDKEIDLLKSLTVRLLIEKFVTFTGIRSDLHRIYADIDVLAITSFNEGTPVSILEAMAAGVPCISTNVGGISDLLSENRGILVPDFSVDIFSNKLFELFYNVSLKENIIKNAFEYFQNTHSKDILLKNIDKLYRESFQSS